MPPALFALAYMLDLAIGDPAWLPHPVRLMGMAIERGETMARAAVRTPRGEFLAGMLLTITIVALTGIGSWWLLHLAQGLNRPAAAILSAYLAVTTLATRSLLDEACEVGRRLRSGDLQGARNQVGHIVSRDTRELDESEIVPPTVQTRT